jgi:hypothetical protein
VGTDDHGPGSALKPPGPGPDHLGMANDVLHQDIPGPRWLKFWALFVLLLVINAFIPAIVVLAVTAYAAPKTSHRWFDAFLWLVPFLGPYWGIKILWRWCSLPDRYWDVPPALPDWRQYQQPQQLPAPQPSAARFKV